MRIDVKKVKELGEEIGYGHMMGIIHALWKKSLEEKGYPTNGAFVGTCLDFIDKEIVELTEGERELYDKLIQE